MHNREGKISTGSLAVLCICVFLVGFVVFTLNQVRHMAQRVQTERAQQEQTIQEWKYTKTFEDMGNGVYHFEPSNDDEATSPHNPRGTQGYAKILGEWRALHPDRRIVSVTELHRTLIIVTELR